MVQVGNLRGFFINWETKASIYMYLSIHDLLPSDHEKMLTVDSPLLRFINTSLVYLTMELLFYVFLEFDPKPVSRS